MLVLALGVAWRTVRYGLRFPLWGDEAFVAVNLLTRDLAGLLRPLEFDQIAPPGFLWLEWLMVRALGPGEAALRLVPWLASVTALGLFWGFCRQVSSRRATLVAVAVLAASFYPVRHGNEVKPYATDLLLSLGVSMLGWRVWRNPRDRTAGLALLAVSTIGVWCSYPLIFPILSLNGLLLVRWLRNRQEGGGWICLAQAVIPALSFLALVVLVAEPQAKGSALTASLASWHEAFPPLARPWKLPWWLLKIHTGHMLAYPHGGKNFLSTGSFLLVVAGAVALIRAPTRRPLLWLMLGPLTAAFGAAALQRYPYGTAVRVTMYMTPAFCLLIGEGAVALLRSRRLASRGATLIALLLGLIPLGFLARDVAMPYSRSDDLAHRQIVERIARQTAPGDRWIVFNGAMPPPRDVPNLMLSRWIQRVAEVRYNLLALAPVPTLWEPDPATVEPTQTGRTWLIVQFHGNAKHYPAARLAAFQAALAQRLGPPNSSEVISLADHETLTVTRFR